VVAPEAEPGEPLIVAGRVFASDGRTPKEGMTVHVYQTDASGRYDRPGSGSAAPRLSATVTTDAAGRYEFRTIRPGAYPEGRWPAHIHFKVSGPGYKERYVSDLVFADDPRVPAAERESSAAAGRFAFVCTPSRGEDGVLRCERNIRLD
jgi:protocatechuate 3,4-dioxygenase beta subunit